MSQSRKHITINRNRDWGKALLWNLKIDNHQVCCHKESDSPGDMFEMASILTYRIDSVGTDFAWNRLIIDTALPDNSTFTVYHYASNDKLVEIDGEEVDLDRFLQETGLEPKEKIKRTAVFYQKSFTNLQDGLLNAVGRYIWIKVDFVISDTKEFALHKLKIFMEDESILNYLPEIYRRKTPENEFFLRFIQIFNSLILDLEHSIDKIGDSLDFELASGEVLTCIAGFVGIDNYKDESELRTAVRHICRHTEAIGVKSNMLTQIEEVFKIKPNIVEYYEVEKITKEGDAKEIYSRLFGSNAYRFFVLLREDEVENENVNLAALQKKLRQLAPVHTDFEIIILQPYIILDKHSYVGVNTYVSDYKNAALTGRNSIFYNTYIGGSIDEK